MLGHFLVSGWPQGIQWGHRGGVLRCLPLAHSVCLLGLLEETTYYLSPGDVEQEEEEEEAPRPSLTIPEDLDSREAMVSWPMPCPFSSLLLWSNSLPSGNRCSHSTSLPPLS